MGNVCEANIVMSNESNAFRVEIEIIEEEKKKRQRNCFLVMLFIRLVWLCICRFSV